jgi:hypothetical protein
MSSGCRHRLGRGCSFFISLIINYVASYLQALIIQPENIRQVISRVHLVLFCQFSLPLYLPTMPCSIYLHALPVSIGRFLFSSERLLFTQITLPRCIVSLQKIFVTILAMQHSFSLAKSK